MNCRFSEKMGESFRLWGYALLPGLVDRLAAHRFDSLTRPLPARRVICGNPDLSWEEQQIPLNHEVGVFFAQLDLIAKLGKLLDGQQFERLSCWTCRYRKGEHIGPHKDRSGSLQIVLSLNGTSYRDDGALTLLVDRHEKTFHLQAGDAVVFRAHEIVHYTSAPLGSPSCTDPVRIVAVARYFFRST